MNHLSIRHQLREHTHSLHERVDESAASYDLGTVEGLRSFLEMMVRGLGQVEAGLEHGDVQKFAPDWPMRARLHLAMEELGLSVAPAPVEATVFRSEAEIWGALYVLEGSRLGSRVLWQAAADSAFLRASSEDREWPAFLTALEQAHARLNDLPGMVEGARKAFNAFL